MLCWPVLCRDVLCIALSVLAKHCKYCLLQTTRNSFGSSALHHSKIWQGTQDLSLHQMHSQRCLRQPQACLCLQVITPHPAWPNTAFNPDISFLFCFRGYKGRVVSSTDSDVRMELEAQYKTVTVKRGQLTGQESSAAPASFGRPKANIPPWQMGSGRNPLQAGAATPLHGSATPLHPSATPMHPSATPMHPGKLTSCTLVPTTLPSQAISYAAHLVLVSSRHRLCQNTLSCATATRAYLVTVLSITVISACRNVLIAYWW